MSVETHIRLEAGPFDGDEGLVDAAPPDVVWAFACPACELVPDHVCGSAGVHWVFNEVRRDRLVEIFKCEMHAYRYDRVVVGTFVYTWVGLSGVGPLVEREEALA